MAPEWILGVIHWRGEVVPLLDGACIFGAADTMTATGARLLVFENGGVPIAVRIAGVPILAAIADGEVVPGGDVALPPHVRGLCDFGEQLVYLLDIEALLAAHCP